VRQAAGSRLRTLNLMASPPCATPLAPNLVNKAGYREPGARSDACLPPSPSSFKGIAPSLQSNPNQIAGAPGLYPRAASPATHGEPAPVRTRVMSATQSRSGPSARAIVATAQTSRLAVRAQPDDLPVQVQTLFNRRPPLLQQKPGVMATIL